MRCAVNGASGIGSPGMGSNVPLAMWSSVALRSGTSNMSRNGRLIRSAMDASTWVPSRKAKCTGIGVSDSETVTGTP